MEYENDTVRPSESLLNALYIKTLQIYCRFKLKSFKKISKYTWRGVSSLKEKRGEARGGWRRGTRKERLKAEERERTKRSEHASNASLNRLRGVASERVRNARVNSLLHPPPTNESECNERVNQWYVFLIVSYLHQAFRII